ncbi:hypothetical protein M1C59_02740 [Gordonia terrae]|uniref:hypothetical protein n=1 Tax=Gordonia terrae TaxID=2055 RepID=UPI00200A2C8D|nr:hypothetical protein [Gordonia terrae]UPW09791.1 hypothetical protein M1C59_02740 [Gordonia terrae]
MGFPIEGTTSMDVPLTPTDLQKFEEEITDGEAEAMIETAWARAQDVAPCLTGQIGDEPAPPLTDVETVIVKDVLRAAILRWHDRGSGAHSQRTAGEYGETLRAGDTNLFRPNEIRDLQKVCGTSRRRGKASTILTGVFTLPTPTVHPFLTGPDESGHSL